MSKAEDYDAGYGDGRNNAARASGDLDYERGYFRGKQEYDFWNDKDLYPSLRDQDGEFVPQSSSSPSLEPATLPSIIFGSIGLTLLWWAFAGLLLLILWISGSSDSFFFRAVFHFALWSGIGFVVLMTIGGVVEVILRQIKKNRDH